MSISRLLTTSWKVSVRSKRRLLSFMVIYAILGIWMSVIMRRWAWADPVFLFDALFALIAGAIVAMVYGFILSHFRQRDIATLKCLGWNNNEIKWFIAGELIFVTIISFLGTLEVFFEIVGILFYFFGGSIVSIGFVQFILFPPHVLLVSFFTILLAQVPGILIATWRVLTVRPIVALRKAM